jgi:23S rRNA-/tRNA-specific pseudouridylate synthase
MTIKQPEEIENSFRITLNLEERAERLDTVLLEALKEQDQNQELKNISKGQFKKLFTEKKVLIKGQNAKPKSSVSDGTTFVDILLG